MQRLLVVPTSNDAGAARAADIVLRAGAFGVVVIPTLRLTAQAWTRLAGLAHRANALLLALGPAASDELRYFASVRLRLQSEGVRWNGGSGPFGLLAASDVSATVIKHKRAAPGKTAGFTTLTFEQTGPPLGALRAHALPRSGAAAIRTAAG